MEVTTYGPEPPTKDQSSTPAGHRAFHIVPFERPSNPSHHSHARLLHEARHWHGVGLVGGEAARVPEEHLFRNQDPERDEPPPKVKPQFGSTKFQKLALAFADDPARRGRNSTRGDGLEGGEDRARTHLAHGHFAHRSSTASYQIC